MRARAVRRRGAADVAEGMLSWAVFMQQDGRRARVPVDLGAGHFPLWEITCAPTGETHQVLFELPRWFEAPPLSFFRPCGREPLVAAWCVRGP
eukprot:4224691-Prymnesium_polylepis.1